MTRRDGLFIAGVATLSALVPTLILWGAPFAEARRQLGVLVGWSLALAVVVPSYVLLARALRHEDGNRFLRAFMGGTAVRLFVSVVAVVMFATLVDESPVMTFLLTFFLGYVLLTGLELGMAPGGSPEREHA